MYGLEQVVQGKSESSSLEKDFDTSHCLHCVALTSRVIVGIFMDQCSSIILVGWPLALAFHETK